jgi:class 3 adenylate cyclase
MRCSRCGFDNPDEMKFCGQCTAPLALVCPNCHFENPPGFKFCGQCTAPLVPEAPIAHPPKPSISVHEADSVQPLDGERKTVTALFADIRGSTELMEDLDPEEARALVDPALKLMIEAVHRYDGYIVQSTGDGIFALFGAPLAHEDHPQRALYAALRMQNELRRYGAKLQEEGRAPVEIRVGVNSGEVVVRSLRTGKTQTEYTPIGHTANLASRLQAVARTGSIVISENTRGLVEGYFALRALGATRVKGIAEPVKLHEVMGLGPLRTRFQRAAGRGLTKFVGRSIEEIRGRGLKLLVPLYLGRLAALSSAADNTAMASDGIVQAQHLASETGERAWDAELRRIEGEISLKQGRADEAEHAFRSAIEIADAQQAKSWELRAASSLARLLVDQARRQEAHLLLAPIYGWFTEGFDTADLKQAKALLDALNS